MTRDIAILGYLSVPLMVGGLVLFSRLWPATWASQRKFWVWCGKIVLLG